MRRTYSAVEEGQDVTLRCGYLNSRENYQTRAFRSLADIIAPFCCVVVGYPNYIESLLYGDVYYILRGNGFPVMFEVRRRRSMDMKIGLKPLCPMWQV